MKILGMTLFASAVALSAGCSSAPEGARTPGADDTADNSIATNTQDLRRGPRRPRPTPPPRDPCAAVRCAAGTSCVVVDGNATCQEDISACAAVLCLVGTVCEVVDGEPTCVPVEPEPAGPFCGGIAAIECPGSGSCVDAPGDGCDPENGGADCGGVCECNVRALCVEGFQFDPSPEVCACVPEQGPDSCAAVLCEAGTECVVIDGRAVCEPQENPCAAVSCPVGNDCQVVDGAGVCVPAEPRAPFCGGFAGIECPGAGICVDDPSDDCDPENGGADCGGVCECNSLALCIEGFTFDPSPEVCACVPDAAENPCNLIDCFPGQICDVQNGEAVCVPAACD